MNEIYVIVSGQYSDWQLEGYSTDREQAELICYHHNQLSDNKKDWLYGDWYVMPADEIKMEEEIKHSIYWNYAFTYYKSKNTNEWVVWDNQYDYVRCDKKAVMPSVERVGLNETSRRIEWSNTRFLSYEEAQKIAYDMLMQNLAAELLK